MAMADETFSVDGMSCSRCENRIVHALEALPGVRKASAYHKQGRVRVIFDLDTTSAPVVKTTIQELGYQVLS